jgi:predicted nucleic acid-binding protein
VGYLLDTNVISELRKGRRADPNVMSWFESVRDDQLFLSVLTVGELRRGVERILRRDPPSGSVLDAWLQRILATHADRIVPIDREAAEEWGRLNVPDPLPVVDGLLAASAKVHGLTLVTRNVRDIATTGVDHLDPFSGA